MYQVLLFDDDEAERGSIKQKLTRLLAGQANATDFSDASGPKPKDGITYERHIESVLSSIIETEPVGLIACDKELGKYAKYPGLSANAISIVARNLGIPFCQYSRQPEASKGEISLFKSLMDWDSEEITLTGISNDDWAGEIANLLKGFESIRERYTSDIQKMNAASALASIMGREDASTRISLYGLGDQSVMTEVFAFAEGDHANLDQRMPRVLGTWLLLSLIRFPGLLVNEIAAASYLNIDSTSFKESQIQEHFEQASYEGPFNEIKKLWWREDLDCLLFDAEVSDGKEYLQTKTIDVSPCEDPETFEPAGFYCMISQLPVSRANSRGNINWFPSGADLSRIRLSNYDQITSIVNI